MKRSVDGVSGAWWLAWWLACCFVLVSAAAARAEDSPATLWVDVWNTSNNHEDIGRLLALDTPNRIYVAGSTYDPATLHDYLLLQYDAAGNLIWQRRYGGAGDEIISDLRVPAAGEVVATGMSVGQGSPEVATVKYDNLGNLLWERRFPLPGATSDMVPRMAVDGAHDILVSATANNDFLVLKYASDGTLLWSHSQDGPGHEADVATGIAAGADGSVYITGTADNSTRFMTIKFSPSGDLLWEQTEAGDIGSVFSPSAVAVGTDQNPVMAGNPESTCGVFQFKIWKCDAATGNVLWSDTAPDQPCFSLIFQDLAIDAGGNIVAACSGSDTSVDTHMQVLRYSPDGVRQWIRQYDGPGNGEDVASAIATDGAGAAYVTGYTDFPPQNRDYATVKFSADGTQAWAVTWGSVQGTNDMAQDIAVDDAGGVIVTGHSYNPATNEDFVTVKYQQGTTASIPEAARAAEPRPALEAAPNPVSGVAAIHFSLAHSVHARLLVFTAAGRLVRTLADEAASPGPHVVRWNGTDAGGTLVPAGVYVIRLETAGQVYRARLHLIR